MSRFVLRPALFVLSGILLAGAAWLAISDCSLGVVLRVALPGLVLLFALVVEHWRYKPLTSCRPGPDWLPTEERFIDPESRKPVTAFYKPSTGERRYVAG